MEVPIEWDARVTNPFNVFWSALAIVGTIGCTIYDSSLFPRGNSQDRLHDGSSATIDVMAGAGGEAGAAGGVGSTGTSNSAGSGSGAAAGTNGTTGTAGDSVFDGSSGAGGDSGDGSSARSDATADRRDAEPPRDAGAEAACPGGGSALSFDVAKHTYVAIPGGSLPIGDAPRTVEMWVYNKSAPPTWSPGHDLFTYGATSSLQGFGVDFDAFPMMELYVNPLANSLFFNTGIIQDGWFHVAATYDGSATRAFVNGADKGALEVGKLATPSNSLFVGVGLLGASIDELRVWNVARTDTEIQSDMHVRLTGSEPGLVGYWRFDEGAGTTARDSSSGAIPGALVNGPTWVPSGAPLGCR
jgi:hypothetical protein